MKGMGQGIQRGQGLRDVEWCQTLCFGVHRCRALNLPLIAEENCLVKLALAALRSFSHYVSINKLKDWE